MFMPFTIFALLSRSLPVVAQNRGHMAGPPLSSPLRYAPSFLLRAEFSIYLFPRRLVRIVFVVVRSHINSQIYSSRWSQDRLQSLWSGRIPQGKNKRTKSCSRIYHN